MAITTTQKLVSSLRMTLPFPDSVAMDDGDLQHSLWNYAGILAGPAIPIPVLIRAGVPVLRAGSVGHMGRLWADAEATGGVLQ